MHDCVCMCVCVVLVSEFGSLPRVVSHTLRSQILKPPPSPSFHMPYSKQGFVEPPAIRQTKLQWVNFLVGAI